ncbi:MAG TPA: glycosyltransferase family 39 protein [Polyangiaceae bacterium]|nr:glycosyltransferase family 39 protein [Polyangiaceae bacterium]
MRSDDESSAASPEAEATLEAVQRALDTTDDEDELAALIPKANPARPQRLWWAVAALVPVFLLMATDGHFELSVLLCVSGLSIATFAVLDALGTFDDAPSLPAAASGHVIDGAEPRAVAAASLRLIAPRLAELGGALFATWIALRLAVAGVLPHPTLSAGLLVTLGLIAIVATLCRVAEALRIFAEDGVRWFARRGFWLVMLNVLLYVPLLGSYSLSDPWEVHYGEVAREMLARDDWLSLWWAQDGWFWSKPVLDFWLQGVSFSLSGVHFMPDQMLAGAGSGLSPAPEWAARLPIFLLTVIASYLLYKAVAKAFGGRAGFLAGLVLTTAPYWYLIAHQSMTDMPYVAPLTAALALVVLGMRTDPDVTVQNFELAVGARVLRVSAFHLLFGAILCAVLPQLVYLLTRNVTLQLHAPNFGFRWHWDEFMAGSGGGNCGLPGNEACRWLEPVNRLFQPSLGALVWSGALGLLLFVNRGERRSQRLYFLGAWFFTALSALGKGAPGLVLPLVIALVGIGTARRYKDFARAELVGLCLIFACVCLPWYVQMYMRHGAPFTERLLFHDMYKRAFVHVHDTNTGDDVTFRYYVWQLGYGLFPWVGFGAAGLLWWLRYGRESDDAQSEVMSFMVLWFTVAFAMFAITLTKFHHYALPTVPPIAAVTGVMLDRAFGAGPLWRPRQASTYFAGLAASALLLVYGAQRLFPGGWDGLLKDGQLPRNAPLFGAALFVCGLGLALYTSRKFGQPPNVEDSAFGAKYERAVLAVLGVAAAIPIVLVGRDLSTTVFSDIEGQARLMHLFTYNYRRAWPSESLNFNGVLSGFTLAATVVALGFAWPKWRRHALSLFAMVAVLWTAWGIDVYLVNASPHWGQRETILAYYAARKGPQEPFVAYQMNWKGENFYTGNRVPAFVSSGAKFKSFIAEQKKKGTKVMFFTTEHSRIAALKSELGPVKDFKVITDRKLNNKFTVARAVF